MPGMTPTPQPEAQSSGPKSGLGGLTEAGLGGLTEYCHVRVVLQTARTHDTRTLLLKTALAPARHLDSTPT